MEGIGEIFAVPFFGQGHFLPFMELCRQFCSMQYKTTLIISSDLTSSVPASLLHHELFSLAEFTRPLPPLPTKGPKPRPGSGLNPIQIHFQKMGDFIESLLESRPKEPDPSRPIFSVVDNLMCWSKGIFMKFQLPVVAFFAFAAVDVALEYAAWKADVENLQPGVTRVLPGLPEYMAFNYSDLTIRRNSHPNPFKNDDKGAKSFGSVEQAPDLPDRKKKSFPTEPGDEPAWVDDTKGAVAFFINSCHELEGVFIDYISTQIGVPVWAVGPLLPEEYWKWNHTSIFADSGIRPNRKSNYSEQQVMQWLDEKPRRSVIYVSFGSQITPKLEEHDEIANALEELNRPFIWVLQTGSDVVLEYYPSGLETKVGNRGLIIQGWAPQLLILNHPSVGGCLTHSGWNSAMEAIGRGIPTLAWPIRGDQFYNAKSIESHLKVGYIISKRDDTSEIITKNTIIQGIDRLMDDEGVHERAEALGKKVFKQGFPASSVASLTAFKDFTSRFAA
ncbi:hypothetical protein ACH5RR_039163 [Cinchona calisaya]|uniref:Glycosyltransferase n=1 Tax=Cinchona calisaya TaxID=153742 RepID=A0ABD2Y1J9_9GENT